MVNFRRRTPAMSARHINKESPIPAYYQIQQDLLDRINNHEWLVNEMLPPESVFLDEYNVSRVTLRQALAELEKDGIIRKERGKGSFLKAITPKPYVHELSYRMANGGRVDRGEAQIVAEIIRLEHIVASSDDLVKKLALPEEDRSAIYLKRLYRKDGQPIAIGRSWLPSYLLPAFAENGLVNGSLNETLHIRYNLAVDRVDDWIEAARCTANDNTLLGCSINAPLLVIQGIAYLKDGTPIENAQTVWLGDAVRFKLTLRDLN